MGNRKQNYIPVRANLGSYNYKRATKKYDNDQKKMVKLYPEFVYNISQWKDHWEDVIGYDDPNHPYRLKDLIHINRPQDIHPDFLQVATQQLTPIINNCVGTELQNLEIMFEFSTGFAYFAGEFAYTKIDIVFFGNISMIWIKWKSAISGQKYIPMSQPVTTTDIHFDICRSKEIMQIQEWETHPNCDMNIWIKRVREVILKVKPPKNNYSFDFQIAGLSWPDAHFDLVFSDALSDDAIQAMNEGIGNFVNGWNEQEEQNGQEDFIHNMLDMRRTDEKSCEVLVDFGSASELSLLKFLDFLQEIGGDKLLTVVLS